MEFWFILLLSGILLFRATSVLPFDLFWLTVKSNSVINLLLFHPLGYLPGNHQIYLRFYYFRPSKVLVILLLRNWETQVLSWYSIIFYLFPHIYPNSFLPYYSIFPQENILWVFHEYIRTFDNEQRL